jgi:ATP-dependent DNA helicase RecQ
MNNDNTQPYSPEQLLTERFHISTGFHPGQREIIGHLLQGKRVLAIQHTGWGKSLCYQMASLYYPNLTIVFSPLKALMRDQYKKCNDVYGIESAIVSSDFEEHDNEITLRNAVAGKVKLLFIAPERLSNDLWQSYVPQMKISMIVIDEAHCISTWGHDFRPHYRRIITLFKALPASVPVLALTATANQRVEEDILQQMENGVLVIRGKMRRSNLGLDVVNVANDTEKLAYLATMLPLFPGIGIIYTATRKEAEFVASFLQHQKISAEYYHAGRGDEQREDIEEKWKANQYKVVCATNALGMGIDKQDVRFIIHYQIPASPIYYYQEIGRAGRDGLVARCILLYDPADLSIQEHFINSSLPESAKYEKVLSCLKGYTSVRAREVARITGLSQTAISIILSDLEDQRIVEHSKDGHALLPYAGKPVFTDYDNVHLHKCQELQDIKEYAMAETCYMEYLATYLGDSPESSCGNCGNCRNDLFPTINISERIAEAVKVFEDEWLPRIEKRGSVRVPEHEAGWSLSYHGNSQIGRIVRASKYEGAGYFPEELVDRAVHVIRANYPIEIINGIVSVPPTRSELLVENFARRVAERLAIAYLPVVRKTRMTQEQKLLSNRVQKQENVKDAFFVVTPTQVAGRVLLVIDDIYDSGYMLRELGKTLMKAGAYCVYPFTITRTRHSDDV